MKFVAFLIPVSEIHILKRSSDNLTQQIVTFLQVLLAGILNDTVSSDTFNIDQVLSRSETIFQGVHGHVDNYVCSIEPGQFDIGHNVA